MAEWAAPEGGVLQQAAVVPLARRQRRQAAAGMPRPAPLAAATMIALLVCLRLLRAVWVACAVSEPAGQEWLALPGKPPSQWSAQGSSQSHKEHSQQPAPPLHWLPPPRRPAVSEFASAFRLAWPRSDSHGGETWE